MAEDTRGLGPAIADPAPLGLGAFALTTFALSVANAGWSTGSEWVALAFFYGGLAQFAAGMWEFRKGNTFGATAFGTYGAFWLSLAFYDMFLAAKSTNPAHDLAWFVLAFAIFNTYMLLWSLRVSIAVFLVFLTLEATEILYFWGQFNGSADLVKYSGYVGVATAAVAWYASAAGVVNSQGERRVLPVGRPPWREPETIRVPEAGALPRVESTTPRS
jgi:hypothetical protein